MGMERRQFVLVLIVAVVGPVQSQLFDTDTVRHQDLATLTCNVRKVSSKGSGIAVSQLIVGKKAPNDTKFHDLIRYSYVRTTKKARKEFADEITKSNGRITATADGMLVNGIIDYNNADTMNVELTINNATCDDAGVYKCEAYYEGLVDPTSMVKEVENSLSVTGRLIKEFRGHTRPDRSKLHGDEKVTFVCRVNGPSNVAIHWKYQACPKDSAHKNSIFDWHSASNIHNSVDSGVQIGGCTYTRLTSELRNVHLYNGTHNISLIQCIVGTEAQAGGAFVEHLQWNRTFQCEALVVTNNHFPSDENLHKSWFQNWKFYIVAAVIALMVGFGVSGTLYYRNKHNAAPEKQDKNDQIGNEVHPDSMDGKNGNEVFYDVADDTVDTEEAYLADIYGTSI